MMLLKHDRVEFPDPTRVVEDRVQTRLVEFSATVRPTEPVNPFSDDTETVELPRTTVLTETFSGLAVKIKSGLIELETANPPTLAEG